MSFLKAKEMNVFNSEMAQTISCWLLKLVVSAGAVAGCGPPTSSSSYLLLESWAPSQASGAERL